MIMERLCYAAKLKHLIEIIKRLTPYAVFLSRNRHSSHIIQAILARLCYLLKNEGIGNLDEDYLRTTTLGFLSLILKEISWLAKELSASHVVRSALCALAGTSQSNHYAPVKFPVKSPIKFPHSNPHSNSLLNLSVHLQGCLLCRNEREKEANINIPSPYPNR